MLTEQKPAELWRPKIHADLWDSLLEEPAASSPAGNRSLIKAAVLKIAEIVRFVFHKLAFINRLQRFLRKGKL